MNKILLLFDHAYHARHMLAAYIVSSSSNAVAVLSYDDAICYLLSVRSAGILPLCVLRARIVIVVVDEGAGG